MKRWILALMLLAVAPIALPTVARAASDEQDVQTDARLEGYASKVTVEDDGVTLVWFLFVFLSTISCGVLFMNAKRTHLD